MGGSVVVFDKQKGVNFTKGKKRMRGDIIKGPEIKKWNCISAGNSYSSYDFYNLLSTQTPIWGAYSPCRLQWPPFGTGSANRIGARITFLGFRLKGWFTLAPDQLKTIRWRLNLVRLDMPNGSYSFDASSYLSQFMNSDTQVPSTFDQTRYETFCRHNFYKKFKDVANTVFKCKTIASGTFPATNRYKKLYINLTGSIGGNSAILGSSSAQPNFILGQYSGNVGYLPFDVKVKLNDTIDCTEDQRRYYLVFEADCGYGWSDEGRPSGTEPGVMLNLYCRGYYTDD